MQSVPQKFNLLYKVLARLRHLYPLQHKRQTHERIVEALEMNPAGLTIPYTKMVIPSVVTGVDLLIYTVKKNVPPKTKSALNVAVLDTLLRFVYQSPKYLQIKSTLTVILILLRALMALNIAYADLQTSELTDATKASLLTPVVTSQ